MGNDILAVYCLYRVVENMRSTEHALLNVRISWTVRPLQLINELHNNGTTSADLIFAYRLHWQFNVVGCC